MWLGIKIPGMIAPGTLVQFMGMFWAPIIAAAAIALWWLLASRARWLDRVLILLVFLGGAALTWYLAHPSVAFMGLILTGLPWVLTAWVAWLLVTPFAGRAIRMPGLALVILLVFSYWTLVRLDGVYGSFDAQTSWRWMPTTEAQYLASEKPRTELIASAASAGALTLQPGDWPGFRGPNRDGKLSGVRIATDWQKDPPKQLWRHAVGPGWGSFCVIGDRLYTQEQRGEKEAVVCYDAGTGKEIWIHSDPARFEEMISGPGPRGTPTFVEGKIYSFGGNGMLDCLDAATGKEIWTRDVKEDLREEMDEKNKSKPKVPMWGFAASPLVVQGIVTVYAGGPEGQGVMAYDAAAGKPVWSAGHGRLGYCSTQLSRLGGVEQLLISTDVGVTAFEPSNGKVLWEHEWPTTQIVRITQPTVLSDTDLLIGTGMGVGTRRVHVTHDHDAWKADEVWTTKAVKPYFNDMVVYQGNAFGFDGPMITCVNLEDGKSRWRERGYGSGQALLLEDQGILLLTSERGDVGLVEAKPQYHELAKFKAFEAKTWNHPVIAHGKLFLRNGEEAACYELKTEHAELTVSR
jgi:outer membrane protein assembly factor BamB